MGLICDQRVTTTTLLHFSSMFCQMLLFPAVQTASSALACLCTCMRVAVGMSVGDRMRMQANVRLHTQSNTFFRNAIVTMQSNSEFSADRRKPSRY